jgi:hypothetical protein
MIETRKMAVHGRWRDADITSKVAQREAVDTRCTDGLDCRLYQGFVERAVVIGLGRH